MDLDGSSGKAKVVFEIGDRSDDTFLRLYDLPPPANSYHTDSGGLPWLSYNQHHVEKFGKVNHNEGVHSILQDRLEEAGEDEGLQQECRDAVGVFGSRLPIHGMGLIASYVENTGKV